MAWENYIDDESGDFNIALYLYNTNKYLMKAALDMGTLLSSDPQRLRAYKEQIKSIFKSKWLETASALESYDVIVPCECFEDTYCEICKGARYRLNTMLSPGQIRETFVILGDEADSDVAKKLQVGLKKALKEVEEMQQRQLREVR